MWLSIRGDRQATTKPRIGSDERLPPQACQLSSIFYNRGERFEMHRREFLKSGAAVGLSCFARREILWASSADARVELLVNEPIGTISPHIYGHFTEHIGGVIYDGVWVGEHSKIPNQNGIRTALVDSLREIHAPIIRWPGGCFADSYDWRDGIGDINDRPKRTNFWEVEPDAARLKESGPQIFDPNEFGTNEFVHFCRLSGAEPYIAANVRSLTPLDFDHWVEYCNSPTGSTSLAQKRGADPLNVRYWGIGNESWGCGGNFTPEDYATEFRRFTSWIPRYGLDLQLIGSGPSGNDMDWTHRFFEKIFAVRRYDNPAFVGWSVHHYSSGGDALKYDQAEWYGILREASRIEQIITDQWATMGQYDREHQVKLVVDEYGPWYKSGTELDPTHIFGQQITMRDALATALTLDTFNRNADKVSIATCAQLVNNLNALFLAHGDQFIKTPNFHVFRMYAGHQGGQAIRALFSAPDISFAAAGKPDHLWGLNGSASRNKNSVTLTLVNPGMQQARNTQIAINGATVKSASAIVLAASDVHAHNTFDQPDAVQPAEFKTTIASGLVILEIPAAAVVSVNITIS